MTLPDRNRGSIEVGDELIRRIGEVDSVWEVQALSLDPNEILKLARVIGGNSIFINIDENYGNPTAGPKPKKDITFSFEIFCFVPVGSTVEEALRDSNGAMAIARVIRDRLNNVILFDDLNDGKFLPTPLAFADTTYEVDGNSFVVGVLPGSCTTTYTGGHTVASNTASGFPSNPAEGDQLYHTGFEKAYRRHSTDQWLSESEPPFTFSVSGAMPDLTVIPYAGIHAKIESPFPAVIVGGLIKQSNAGVDAFDLEILVNDVVKETIAFDVGNPTKATNFNLNPGSLVALAEDDSIQCRINGTGATKPDDGVVTLYVREARP